MDRQVLELFCRQLAHWAEAAIAEGRSPFRRAETFFPLLTAAGEMEPPLLLWINRDSYMAGAVVLFPPQRAEEATADGCACAQALGLRHFVAWAPDAIVVWEAVAGQARVSRTLPAPGGGGDSTAPFALAFSSLLDELKLAAVAGAVPAAELSPYYLANLCRHTRRSITPFFIEAFRVAAGETRAADAALPPAAALQQAHLALLRLLALIIEDRLPPVNEPEGLDRVLRFAIDALPAALGRTLDIHRWEIPLPAAVAVRLHHLVRRLGQLRVADNRARCAEALEILLRASARDLGGAATPPADARIALRLNPDRCYPAAETVAEIASPPLLAFTALLRFLRAEAPVRQFADPLLLEQLPSPALVTGRLNASTAMSPSEKRTLAARLRLSWPNRRFSLAANSPRWLFELLHLLGLAGKGSRILVDLPDDWLTAAYGAPLQALLREQFTVAGLRRLPDGLRLDLYRGDGPEVVLLAGASGERRLAWERLRQEAHSFLPLALDLPAPLFALLQEGRLQGPPEWTPEEEEGVYLFTRSTLGRLLWRVVAGQRPLPGRPTLAAQLQGQGFPLPAREILRQLQSAFGGAERPPACGSLDREIARWLGIDPALFATEAADSAKAGRRGRVTEETVESIRRTVFADGVPRFPEHFLYDHFRPQLIEYTFAGPLQAGEVFFHQQRLHDREGQVLLVEGDETARALVLASFGGERQVHLPADRHLTARILEQYLARLRGLRQELIRACYARIADAHTANNVVEKVWNDLSLPPWALVADCDSHHRSVRL